MRSSFEKGAEKQMLKDFLCFLHKSVTASSINEAAQTKIEHLTEIILLSEFALRERSLNRLMNETKLQMKDIN